MKNNKLLLLLLALFTASSYAKIIPTSSQYDGRIKTVNYNAADVTQVKSSGGYLTSLIFANDESIIEAFTGFSDGWDITPKNNILYLKPIAIAESDIAPNSLWNTNLMVKTNKRFYVFDLEVVADNVKNKSYVVSFQYPKNQREIEKREVESELKKLQPPKNWDYRLRIKNGSLNISPNFVYDDGTNTYLGYSKEKSIPSAFEFDEKSNQEIIANFSIRDYSDKYKLMVINKIKPVLVLRQGNNVVGIFNKGFGKTFVKYQDTISNKVERKVLDEQL